MTFEEWRKQDREIRCVTAYSSIIEKEAKWAFWAGRRLAFEDCIEDVRTYLADGPEAVVQAIRARDKE